MICQKYQNNENILFYLNLNTWVKWKVIYKSNFGIIQVSPF